jgi:hypothetical protein
MNSILSSKSLEFIIFDQLQEIRVYVICPARILNSFKRNRSLEFQSEAHNNEIFKAEMEG